jgi:tRNA(Ile)-lysidine synthase
MSLHDIVRRAIRRHALLQPGSRVLAAVSGGADSVAMLIILRELAAESRFELVGLAHLNHQLRGAEADADEAFCARLAASFGLPFDVEQIDVRRLAADQAISIEHAAHTARHAFYDRAAVRAKATAVAVAHTRDDQAETFLLRLLRGAGPRGFGGMHPQSGFVIRPLLDASREEVRDFLSSRQVEFREDASNADVAIARNRVRHELIPFLRERFSPGIINVLDREAAIARDDSEFLDQAAALASGTLVTLTSEGVEIDVEGLLVQPPAIARRVIRDAQQLVTGSRFIGFESIDAVLAAAVSKSPEALDLPGHRMNRRGGVLVLTKSRPGRGRDRSDGLRDLGFAYALDVPGEVKVPEAACAITAATDTLIDGESPAARWTLASRGNVVVIEAGGISGPLVVRNRRPGDRFRPLGLKGHKKLQDFFVDEKVRRSDRDTIPLVVDSSGQIVWVAGHAVAEEFRVTDRTRAVVILKRLPV